MARMPPLAIRPRAYSTLHARNSLRDIHLRVPGLSSPRDSSRVGRAKPAGAVTRGKIKIPSRKAAVANHPDI